MSATQRLRNDADSRFLGESLDNEVDEAWSEEQYHADDDEYCDDCPDRVQDLLGLSVKEETHRVIRLYGYVSL